MLTNSTWFYLKRVSAPLILLILLVLAISVAGYNQSHINQAIDLFVAGKYSDVRQTLNKCGWFWSWGKTTILNELRAKEKNLLSEAEILIESKDYAKAVSLIEKAADASENPVQYREQIAELKNKEDEFKKKLYLKKQALLAKEKTSDIMKIGLASVKEFAPAFWNDANSLMVSGMEDFNHEKFIDARIKWNAAADKYLEANNTATKNENQYKMALLAKQKCNMSAQIASRFIKQGKADADSIWKEAEESTLSAAKRLDQRDFSNAGNLWHEASIKYSKTLLAIAIANDNLRDQKIAITVLEELLKVDPNNITAKQLHQKISSYYLQDSQWWLGQAEATAKNTTDGMRLSIFRDIAQSEVAINNANVQHNLETAQRAIEDINNPSIKAETYCDFAAIRIDANDIPIALENLENAKKSAQIIYDESGKNEAYGRIIELYVRGGKIAKAKRIADSMESYHKDEAYAEIVKTQAEMGDVHGAELTLAYFKGNDVLDHEKEKAYISVIRAYSKKGDVGKARAMADCMEMESEKYEAYIVIAKEQIVNSNEAVGRSILRQLERLINEEQGDSSWYGKAIYGDIITLYAEIGDIAKAQSLVSKLDYIATEKKDAAVHAIAEAQAKGRKKINMQSQVDITENVYSDMARCRSTAAIQAKEKRFDELLKWIESLDMQKRAYAYLGAAEGLLNKTP
jgi:hypothetical protein